MVRKLKRTFKITDDDRTRRGIDFRKWQRKTIRGRSIVWLAFLILAVLWLLSYLAKVIQRG